MSLNKDEKRLFAEWIFLGEKDNIKEAIKLNVNLDEAKVNGMTPLILAVEADQPEVLELLLRSGSNPNQISENNGMTALHWAVEYAVDGMTQNNKDTPYPEPIECIRLLLKYGADKNIEDENGKSPLDYSITEEIRKEFIGK